MTGHTYPTGDRDKEQAGVSKEETKEAQILPTATKSAPSLSTGI